jgi:hypothetical protein
MSDPFVYRSTDSDVLQAWKDAGEAIDAYVKRTEAVLDEHGAGGYKTYRYSGRNVGQFAGLDIPAGEKPPAGWRMNSNYAVPDKRTKAGKAADAALKTVKHPGDPLLKLIGMPPDVEGGPGFISPGVRMLEGHGALYVTWREDPEGRQSFFAGKVTIDHGRWQRVPLSQYYAEVERKDAAKADAEATA